MDSIVQNALLLSGFIIALFGAIFTAFKYFNSEIRAVRSHCDDEVKAHAEMDEKSHTELRAQITEAAAKLQQDAKDLATMTSTLALDAARKADLDKLEARFSDAVRDIKTAVTSEIRRLDDTRQAAIDRLDAKVDGLTAKITEMLALQNALNKLAPRRPP